MSVVCQETFTTLPVDPADHSVLRLTDDSFSPIGFPTGQHFNFYGSVYQRMFVGSNGYITFGEGDSSYLNTVEAFFSKPRIGAMVTDLNPSAGGTVTVGFEQGRAVVTWVDVPYYGSSRTVTVQMELIFATDEVRLTYGAVATGQVKLSGVSSGNGVPSMYSDTYQLIEDDTEVCSTPPTSPTTPSPTASPTAAPPTPTSSPCNATPNLNLASITTSSALPPFKEDSYSLIVGGTEVVPGRFPYMVNLVTSSGFVFCGGSLVTPDVVLSAAHCAGFASKVYIGRHDVTDNSEVYEVFDIVQEVPHPNYSGTTLDNDFVLLKLSGSSSVATVVLDDGSASLETGTDLNVMGWGTTSSAGSSSPVLLEVGVDYVTNTDCNTAYSGSILNSMMCAAAPGRDACQGDSGGPLITKAATADADVQVGVVSWGNGCALPGFPGVYARVSEGRPWIVSTLQGWGQSLPTPGVPPCPTPTASPTTVAPSPPPSLWGSAGR